MKQVICVAMVSVGWVSLAEAQEHRYYPGWAWDTVEVRGGAPNSNYDVEVHARTCTWRVEDSGTTDGDGDDTNRNIRWCPNDNFGPFDDAFRIHYTSGPKTCTREGGIVKGRGAGNNTRNSNCSADIISLPEDDPIFSGLTYTIAQNVQEEIGIWGEAAWLEGATDFTLTLPTGFTFSGVPVVSPLHSDLLLGAPMLSSASELTVPILSNAMTNPLDGLQIVSDISTPGGLDPGDYFFEFCGQLSITPVSAPGNVLDQGLAKSCALGFTKVPEPAGLVLLVVGSGIGLLRRRR